MRLAHEIKLRRTELGLTQAELSALSGVPRSRIGEYERGDLSPGLDTIRALAEVLGPLTVTGGVRTIEHYQRLFEDADTVSTNLLARALYACTVGNADDPDRVMLDELTREALAQHGQVVSGDVALEVLEHHQR